MLRGGRGEHAVDQREHRRPVEAAVLGVDPGRAVGEDHERHGLVEPPVRAVAVQELGAGGPVVARCLVLQAHAEQRTLEVVERGLVALREQRPPAGGPLGAGLGGQVAHAGSAGVAHPRPDRAQPVGDLGGGVRGAVGPEHVHPERVAAQEHHDVPLARRAGPGVGVGRAGGVLAVAGDAGRGEQVLVLLHRHRRALAGGRRERLGVDPVLVVERPQHEPRGARGLVRLGGVGAVGEEEEEVGVERDPVAPPEVARLPEVVEPGVGRRLGVERLERGLEHGAGSVGAQQLVDRRTRLRPLVVVDQRVAPLEELRGAVGQGRHRDPGQVVLGVEGPGHAGPLGQAVGVSRAGCHHGPTPPPGAPARRGRTAGGSASGSRRPRGGR